MSKWIFNNILLGKLSAVLDISVTEIAKRSGMNQPVLYHIIKGDTEMPVKNLIVLCNALRIPSRYFISKNNSYIIPTRETITIEADSWIPITWNRNEVEHVFGYGKKQINWKDVAKVMHLTSQKPHERFLLHTRFPIGSFLDTCSHYNLSPFLFLNDSNNLIDKSSKSLIIEKEVQASPSNAELARKIDTLEKEISELQRKYEVVLNRLKTISDKEDINYGGIAAETPPDEIQ